MAPQEHDYLVILQLGSRQVAATVALRETPEKERVLAHKAINCNWFDLTERGQIQAITDAIVAVSNKVGITPSSVFVAVNSVETRANAANGFADMDHELVLTTEEREIALGRATHQAIATNRMVLHALPQRWTVRDRDGDRDVTSPVGETAFRLTSHVLLVTTDRVLYSDTAALLKSCDIQLEAIIAPPVALYRSMYSGLPRKQGCYIIIDCGARHTNIIVHSNNQLRHFVTYEFGGDVLTVALMERLHLDAPRAEQLKKELDISVHLGHKGEVEGQTYLWSEVQQQDRMLGPAAACCRDILSDFFTQRFNELHERDILTQRGRISLVGRASGLAGFARLIQDISSMTVVMGTGRKDRQAADELSDLLTLGLVRTAALERERLLRERDGSGIHHAKRMMNGLRHWLMQPLS